MSNGEWFEPKRYGYGAGLPISWQGWVVSVAFIAILIGSAFTLADRPLATIAVVVPVIAAFTTICARTTRGGWRWRWGEDE